MLVCERVAVKERLQQVVGAGGVRHKGETRGQARQRILESRGSDEDGWVTPKENKSQEMEERRKPMKARIENR